MDLKEIELEIYLYDKNKIYNVVYYNNILYEIELEICCWDKKYIKSIFANSESCYYFLFFLLLK